MVCHRGGRCNLVRTLFRCRGSVFPTAFLIAVPCGILTAVTKACIELLPGSEAVGFPLLQDTTAWSGFTFLVGFLVVFRTSQAYSRFWQACTAMHRMRIHWSDACSSLIAFCRHSKADEEAVENFQHILVRLFSMLHAVAWADVEDSNKAEVANVFAFRYDLVDAGGIDAESLEAVKHSDARVELVFQWIQNLVVDNVYTEVLCIPAPLLSRVYQELANGMVAFHEAVQISTIPFPFPYMQTCNWLLIMHWIATPMVVAQFVATPWWGALFSFLQVFVFWSLNAIADDIENPFGKDANDIDAESMQLELNRHLVLLLEEQTARAPRLAEGAARIDGQVCSTKTLYDAWRELSAEGEEAEPPARSVRGRHRDTAGDLIMGTASLQSNWSGWGRASRRTLSAGSRQRSTRRSGAAGRTLSAARGSTVAQTLSTASKRPASCSMHAAGDKPFTESGSAGAEARASRAGILAKSHIPPAESMPSIAADAAQAPVYLDMAASTSPAVMFRPGASKVLSQGLDLREECMKTGGAEERALPVYAF